VSDVDPQALSQYLQGAIPGFDRIDAIEKFQGGQSNPSYRLTSGGKHYALRRKPFGKLLRSAHAIEREYRLLAALHPTGFPVPRPILLCEDEAVIGAVFYVMEFVDGRIFWNGMLPEVPKADRCAYYDGMIETQARLHSFDHMTLGLGDFGAPGNYIGRQVERWTKQYRASQTGEIAEVEKLIEWLPRTVPEQSRTCIIHGDYRIDNIIYAADGPQVRAILDWELATIGDPLADFAYLAMNWALEWDGRASLGNVDLLAEGLPTLDEAVDRYCAATGRAGLPDLHWYFAYNLFRLVGILQGIKQRVADGNASSPHAAAMAERIVPLATAAWNEARRAGAKN